MKKFRVGVFCKKSENINPWILTKEYLQNYSEYPKARNNSSKLFQLINSTNKWMAIPMQWKTTQQ